MLRLPRALNITKRVTGKVQPGSIVLFHNAAKHTPEALPGIIEKLLQDGYTFVPISEPSSGQASVRPSSPLVP